MGVDARAAYARRKMLAGALMTFIAASLPGCDTGGQNCGPDSAMVVRVIDGDTVDLDSGERVRLLMIDTPEITGEKNECYGAEAKVFTQDLLLNQRVTLRYDVECQDRFGRLLAYVSVQDREINTLLVERGYACVLQIPPNGADRAGEFDALERTAKNEMRGMWGACMEVTCD